MRGQTRNARADADASNHAVTGVLTERILLHVRDVVILLSRDRKLHFANPAARRLLARKEALRIQGGRLTATSSCDVQAVERAIDAVCLGGKDKEEVVVIRGTHSNPLVLSIQCVASHAGDVILVVGSDGHVEPRHVQPLLRRCFGLTSSEAEVAAALAAGRSSAAIAAARGVSLNTVRTQIKSIAAKLGCATQSQISTIVRSTPLSADASN